MMNGPSDEVRLRRVQVWTTELAALEGYLCDVLGAEITSQAADAFVAQWGELTLIVSRGAFGAQELEFEVCASRWVDYVARWEFLNFRDAQRFSSEKACFSDGSGLLIRLVPEMLAPNENPNISVRNC